MPSLRPQEISVDHEGECSDNPAGNPSAEDTSGVVSYDEMWRFREPDGFKLTGKVIFESTSSIPMPSSDGSEEPVLEKVYAIRVDDNGLEYEAVLEETEMSSGFLDEAPNLPGDIGPIVRRHLAAGNGSVVPRHLANDPLAGLIGPFDERVTLAPFNTPSTTFPDYLVGQLDYRLPAANGHRGLCSGTVASRWSVVTAGHW